MNLLKLVNANYFCRIKYSSIMQTSRQQEIIEAALHLISTKGIQGLTIKNLAKSISVTEPAIYRHFENKFEILVSILELFQSKSISFFKAEMNNPGTSLQKIDHLFETHFQNFYQMPPLASVVFSEEIFRNEEKIINKIKGMIENTNEILTLIIKQGQINGEIRKDIEADHLTIIILGAMRLYIKKWQLSNYSFDLLQEGSKIKQSIHQLLIN